MNTLSLLRCRLGLAYISFKQMNIQFVKLDQAITAHILEDKRALTLLSAIFDMMQSLSIEVIVQGIESQEERNLINSLGAHLMQGRLIDSTFPLKTTVSKLEVI